MWKQKATEVNQGCDMQDDTEKLINAVKLRKSIWMVKVPNYTNSYFLGHLWIEVEKDTGIKNKNKFIIYNNFITYKGIRLLCIK